MRKYILETIEGDWKIWTATPLKELLHQCPRTNKGTVTLDGAVYIIDPKKTRRLPYKPKRFLWLVTEHAQVQLWKQGDPEPVEMFGNELYGLPTRDDDRTGEKFAELARSERLARLVRSGFDMTQLLLMLSVVANVILVGALVIGRNIPTAAGK